MDIGQRPAGCRYGPIARPGRRWCCEVGHDCRPCDLAKAEEGKNEHDHDDQADEINDAVHVSPPEGLGHASAEAVNEHQTFDETRRFRRPHCSTTCGAVLLMHKRCVPAERLGRWGVFCSKHDSCPACRTGARAFAQGDMSSVSIAGCCEHLRHSLGRFVAALDRVAQDVARSPDAAPRTAATINVFVVLACAALTLAPPPPPPPPRSDTIAAKPIDGDAGVAAVPGGPVRIVGATPRSDECREQVWPYIEPRCLTRLDPPKAKAEAAAAIAAGTRERATAGAAPVAPETSSSRAGPGRSSPA